MLWGQTALHLSLLGALGTYMLLPLFGWVWHDVVPEHDHWFIVGSERAAAIDFAPQLPMPANACVQCNSESGQVVLHTFNPASVWQSFLLAMGLPLALVIYVSFHCHGQAWIHTLTAKGVVLPCLDPPPER
jgi:hypothetical protein